MARIAAYAMARIAAIVDYAMAQCMRETFPI
jgi:hypothetical protein